MKKKNLKRLLSELNYYYYQRRQNKQRRAKRLLTRHMQQLNQQIRTLIDLQS